MYIFNCYVYAQQNRYLAIRIKSSSIQSLATKLHWKWFIEVIWASRLDASPAKKLSNKSFKSQLKKKRKHYLRLFLACCNHVWNPNKCTENVHPHRPCHAPMGMKFYDPGKCFQSISKHIVLFWEFIFMCFSQTTCLEGVIKCFFFKTVIHLSCNCLLIVQ